MKALNIIEAECPKYALHALGTLGAPRVYTARKLTPNEIQRLSDIIAMGPITKQPIDDRFLKWGYIQYYDTDEHDAVEAKPDFAKAFYNHPEIRGAYGDEWSDAPHRRRGVIRRYEAEDPKYFLGKCASSRANMSVGSSGGTFEIDHTGRVVHYDLSDDEDGAALEKIEKFDLEEWRRYWNWEGELPGGFDILDLGFWLKDGTYEAPWEHWRDDIRQMGLGAGRVADQE